MFSTHFRAFKELPIFLFFGSSFSQLGKKTRSSHPKVNMVATSRPLELLHVDLMSPTRTESTGGKRYIMVVVDDFSRYS